MMPIFKKEQAAEKLPVAGCGSISHEQSERVYDEQFMDVECETEEEKFFYYGFLSGLAFVSCPEGEEMHGKGAFEFAENAYRGSYQDELVKVMKVRLAEAARSVLEQFGCSGSVSIDGTMQDDGASGGDA